MAKKLLIIINNLGVGGAERLVVDDINELRKRDVQVKLLTLRPENPAKTLSAQCAIDPGDWTAIDFSGLLDLRAWRAVIKFLKKEKPDACVTHLWFSNLIGRIACRLCGIKTVVTFEHNVYDTLKTRKMFLADRALQRFSTRIIAVSDAVRRSLGDHGIDLSRVEVIPNGIDTAPYDGENAVVGAGTMFTFVFVGRLIYQKAVDVLIDAFKTLPSGSELILAGDGKDKADFIERARQSGAGERIRFVGIVNDIPALLKASDCFVLPSRYEGLPMVLLEAIAAKKPIIVSDFESAKELIQNEANGLIVPRENAVELAAAMSKLMDDAQLRSRLVSGAAKTAESISIRRHVDRLLACLSF